MGRDGDQRAQCLGALISGYRRAAGLTQDQLALRAGVSVGAVRDLEQGRTRRPRPDGVGRLADSLCLNEAQRRALTSWLPGARATDPPAASRPATGGGEPDYTTAGHAPGAEVQLEVLGPLAAWRDGAPVKLGPCRQRAVLGLLAVNHGVTLHRDSIIDALWGDHPPASAVTMVQSYVSRLRRTLHAGRSRAQRRACVLEAAGPGYRLRAGAELDLYGFGQAARKARSAWADGDAATACDLYERALALWRGDPLADIEILRGHPAVLGLGQQRAAVIVDYADAAGTLGDPDRVLPLLQELAARDPLDERVHARLMVALAGTGQQAAALSVHQQLSRRLDLELGVRPSAELAKAHERVLRQDIPASPGRRQARVSLRASDQAPPVVPRQLPSAVRQLAGRTAELDALTLLLAEVDNPGAGTVISVIGGTAGVGKTALAVHWAHTISDRFPDGQLYVQLRGSGPSPRTPMSPAEVIREVIGTLGVPPERIPAGEEAQAGLYRSLLAARRMLILLDDARDSVQARPLLPGSPGCLVIITSRRQLAGLAAVECAHLLTLDVLGEAAAGQMLASRLGAHRVSAEPAAVADLIELCARLPVSLAIVAARAAALPGIPLAALAADLRAAYPGLGTGDPATAAGTMSARPPRREVGVPT